MTAKRYFKRIWEEEYYIFDSETISENEFDEKVEYEDYQAFVDSMLGDEVVKLLNEQHETIQRLNQNVDELLSVDIEEELLKENEQLKQAYAQLKHRHSLLHDVCIDAECDRDSYRKDIASLEKENEQLKKGMIGVVDRYIKNVECNPPSSARTYGKIKGALINIREDLRSLIGDFE